MTLHRFLLIFSIPSMARGASAARLPGAIVSCALAVAYILWLYPQEFLLGTGTYWLDQYADTAQYLSGYQAFVNEPWRWPLLRIASINWPEGTLATFVDIIPIYAVLMKCLAKLGIVVANPFGVWVAACYVLQSIGAWWLVRELRSASWVLLLSLVALLLTFPALGARLGHISLMSHWLILFAYAMYIRCARLQSPMPALWAILLFVAFYVNIYIFAMVGVVFFVSIIRLARKLSGQSLARSLAIPPLAIGLSLFDTMLPIPAGQGAAEAGFGYYSMNLLSPFAGGRLINFPHPVAHAGQGEGFNYLGAGGVVLAVYAIWLRVQYDTTFLRRHRALLAALVAVSIYAVSNRVFLGEALLFAGYQPAALRILSDQFRVSARFFWLVGYATIIFGCVTAWRFCDGRLRVAVAALIGATALQLWDLTPRQSLIRAVASRPPNVLIHAAAWDAFLDRQVSTLQYFPPFKCGAVSPHDTLLPVMVYATDRGLNLSTGYVARASKPCTDVRTQILSTDAKSSAYVFVKSEFPDLTAIMRMFNPADPMVCRPIDFAYVCKRSQ